MKVRTRIAPAFVVGVVALATLMIAGPANANPAATNCVVAGTVAISPHGHVLGGGFAGGFTFSGVQMACAGTIVGQAGVGATGSFSNQGAGITGVGGTFSTGSLISLPSLTSTTCGGGFDGTAIGVVAILNLTMDCSGGAMTGGTGLGVATFVPVGVEQCTGGPEPAPLPDADVCLSSVAVAADFALTAL